ncbi:MAG: hypothetical protein IPM63_00310 [Acidobacteriota bacterium]|nr:MAG: hypothetical protein IPM63_00310 [Acidobacteriota bacterium]
MRDEQKQMLAEKIASVLQNDAEGNEQVWKAIDELGRRLEAVERAVTSSPSADPSSNVVRNHPSLEKYAVLEAAEANGAADNGSDDKLCTFEPHGRICDHCSMCSSRGF